MRKIRRNESRLIFRSIGENLNQVTRDEEKRGGGEKKKKRRGGKRGSNLLEIPISVSCKTVKRKMRHRSRFITGTRTFSRQTKILPVLLWPGGREWEWWLMVVDPSPGNMSFPRGKYFIGGRKLAVRILQRIFLFLLLIHSPSVQFRSNFGHASPCLPLLYYSISIRNSKFHRVHLGNARAGRTIGDNVGEAIHFPPGPSRFPAREGIGETRGAAFREAREQGRGKETERGGTRAGSCNFIKAPSPDISNKTSIAENRVTSWSHQGRLFRELFPTWKEKPYRSFPEVKRPEEKEASY